MSLTHRKPRTLKRGPGTFRDDRLFIVACDDRYAPSQYFDAFRFPRIQVHVVPTEDGTCSSQDVLRRLLDIQHEEDDELWLLLDTDHYITGTHLRTFTETLKDARKNGVYIALSRPCFELWLLLHHVKEHGVRALPDASAVEQALRDQLGSYNKTNLN